MKLPEVGNSVVRFFLGLGTLIGGVAAAVSAAYGLGFLTRWVLWNWIITDHSPEALADAYRQFPILDISRTYYPEPLIYTIAPLSDFWANMWYPFIVFVAIFILSFVLYVVYEIGKDLYGPKNRTEE